MANRHFNAPVQSLWHKPILVAGKITLSAAAAVTGSTIKGASVAKTGTGAYTITLDDKFSELISISVQAAESSAAIWGDVGAVDVSGAKTIVIITSNASGAATDVGATVTLYVTAMLSNSSVD
jgi:hypothetical protein